ncbi:MAG TPA: acyl-CoA dehydrogenase family protein, partial [Candidatus Binataceae bacterium]|nr:acyl-CoA dehydrogenase family protein [Candidatus Binataceae bacterium]
MGKIDEGEVRAEVRDWLKANWAPEMSLVEWRSKLADSGWGMPQWPREWYGRGLPAGMVRVVEEEFAAAGAVGAAKTGVRLLAAATLLEHGTDAQKKKFLRRIITGEDSWCQFFSEPGSGSDLAGATTRAELNGDFWIVNGQKVWTTSAHHADFGMLLARTDWDAPKHEGLSFFVIEVRQPGVEVRPLRQMNGHASFNQVFFTDARIPAENLVGRVNEGWKVAVTTLAHERRGADGLAAPPRRGSRVGRIYAEERAELEIANQPYKWY